jgi:VWFA-related protein
MTHWKLSLPLGLVVALMGCATLLPAQQTEPTATTKSKPLLLDVVVTDKSGKPVAGLQEGDFTVLDDRQPAKILSFKAHSMEGLAPSAVDASTAVILVLDEVNASYPEVIGARQWMEKFLRQNDGQLQHPVVLGILTDDGLQLQSQAAVDGNAMADALEKKGQTYRTVDRGTMFGESIRLQISQDALGTLIDRERTQPGRKMVIWVGPGWPLLSGGSISLTPEEERRIFQSAVRFSTGLREARITLYSIDTMGPAAGGTMRTSYYENFTKGLAKPDGAMLANLSLQVFDVQTGGVAIFGGESIEGSLNHCVRDLNAFYTISIEGASSGEGDVYHKLEVQMKPAGLKARTRTGYYAQP